MLQLTTENQRLPLLQAYPRPIEVLEDEHEVEVLDFLSTHPLRTFVMSGWIKDNGLVSPLNRGTFYGCRNAGGKLDGVALIGHITSFEAGSQAALEAFANLTQACSSVHTVLGPQDAVSQFLSYYTCGGLPPRLVYRGLLFEQRAIESCHYGLMGLHRATLEEVDLVVTVHAQMVREELGIDPLKTDPSGFRDRCARRIHQGRTWVCVEDKRLVFKADIISDLPEIKYLEGVYVTPEKRGQGYGSRCIRELTNILLTRTESVCLLAREQSLAGQGCYRKAGYELRDYYEIVLLTTDSNEAAN